MQIELEQTENYKFLNDLVQREPELHPFLTDDDVKEYVITEDKIITYLLIKASGMYRGFFLFFPRTSACCEYHTVAKLDKFTMQATELLFNWIWEHTVYQRIVTYILEENKIGLRFGLRCGLSEYGRNPNSVWKGGKLVSQILLGISKGEEVDLCQPF